ncbi:MAG TPA: hypothetical protein EYP04_12545, partial [Anaerolineae bacterium]|nr:hypothetical protein [Anaerolineae bacterium]
MKQEADLGPTHKGHNQVALAAARQHLAEAEASGSDEVLTCALCRLARLCVQQGEFTQAAAHFTHILELPRGARTPDQRELWESARDISLVLESSQQARLQLATAYRQLDQAMSTLTQHLVDLLDDCCMQESPDSRPELEEHIQHEGGLPALHIYALGRFQVYRGNTNQHYINLGRRAIPRALLRYLVSHRIMHGSSPVPQEQLMETFWPNVQAKSGRGSLHTAIYYLRQALHNGLGTPNPGQMYILFQEGGYTLNPEAPIWIDAEELLRHHEVGHRLIVQNRDEEAAREYEVGVVLYRGDFLPEDVYQDWAALPREQLLQAFLDMSEWLARYHLSNGDTRQCIAYATRVIERDWTREENVRTLMRAYHLRGSPSAAIKVYYRCQQGLKEEIARFVGGEGYEVEDVGTFDEESTDYPDY